MQQTELVQEKCPCCGQDTLKQRGVITRGDWQLHRGWTKYKGRILEIRVQAAHILYVLASSDTPLDGSAVGDRVAGKDAGPYSVLRTQCSVLKKRLAELGVPYPIKAWKKIGYWWEDPTSLS